MSAFILTKSAMVRELARCEVTGAYWEEITVPPGGPTATPTSPILRLLSLLLALLLLLLSLLLLSDTTTLTEVVVVCPTFVFCNLATICLYRQMRRQLVQIITIRGRKTEVRTTQGR